MRWVLGLGVLATIAYVVFVGWLVGDKVLAINTMSLNEIGDFCAGIFGPITFFWMILGFIMQTKEMKQSSKSLRMQADELSKSVKQQEEMASAAKEQISRDIEREEKLENERVRQAQPRVDFLSCPVASLSNNGYRVFEVVLRNSGGNVKDVRFVVRASEDVFFSPPDVRVWDFEQKERFNLSVVAGSFVKKRIELEMRYADVDRVRRKCFFEIFVNGTEPKDIDFREVES